MKDPSDWVAKEKNPKYDFAKHQKERAENGFSVYDWWNFCDYIAWVNIQALEKFKGGSGFPASLTGMGEWETLLDIMIEGFKAHLDLANMQWKTPEEAKDMEEKRKQGMAVYSKYFPSLWD